MRVTVLIIMMCILTGCANTIRISESEAFKMVVEAKVENRVLTQQANKLLAEQNKNAQVVKNAYNNIVARIKDCKNMDDLNKLRKDLGIVDEKKTEEKVEKKVEEKEEK